MPCAPGIFQQNGSFVVHVRINLRLEPAGERGHGEGPLVVHHPGHEVRAVASEIEQRAGAVFHGIGEPVEKLRLHVDLLRPFMTVHRHHFANLAGGVLALHQVPHGAVALVPGGFVIDDHLNAALGGGALDAAGVIHAYRERLLHHHVDVPLRAGFHHEAGDRRCW